MSGIATIICGAPSVGLDKSLCEGFVIAADKGLDYALAAGIVPDLAVGDFDSAKNNIPNNVEKIILPREKDDTDSLAAAKIAEQKGFREMRFLCALGGRLDHTAANIQMLISLKKSGVKAELRGDSDSVFALMNESAIIPKTSAYLSVFAAEQFAVISEKGVKYPADRLKITNTFPIGVSNEIVDNFAEITVHEGIALIVRSSEFGVRSFAN